MSKASKSPSQSFVTLCQQLSNNIADLIEHPDCPKTLRHQFVEFALDVQADSEADVTRERELIEVRTLLPLYLCNYASPSKSKSK
jgi:hypothetical protein